MPWIKCQPDKNCFQNQGFIVQSDSCSQTTIIIFFENQLLFISKNAKINKCKECNIKPVKVASLKVNGFKIQTQSFLAENLPAFKTSDKIVLFKIEIFNFEAVYSPHIINSEKMSEPCSAISMQS